MQGQYFGVAQIVIFLIAHFIIAFPLYTMAQKTGLANAWFAFVPILNLVTMVELAGKEIWWVILLLVPCINIVILVIIWMAIAERMNKPSWLGLLMLVPVLNVLMPYYLAFG